jgi:hypothetical protein
VCLLVWLVISAGQFTYWLGSQTKRLFNRDSRQEMIAHALSILLNWALGLGLVSVVTLIVIYFV